MSNSNTKNELLEHHTNHLHASGLTEETSEAAGLPSVTVSGGGISTGSDWTVRVIRQGQRDLEYVFADGSTLPAGIKLLPNGRLAATSSAYIAKCLLHDLGGPAAWNDGRLVLYRNGVFSELDMDELRARLMFWDGRRVVRKGKQPSNLSLSDTNIEGILRCLANILKHPSSKFFEQRPNSIAFRNVFVQLIDGELVCKEHSPVNRALRRIDAVLDPNATCPRFDQFLNDLLKPQGDIQDHLERIEALWQWIGLALLGLAAKFGKALLLCGLGGNGKSTLLQIISELWPADLRCHFSIQALDDKNNRAQLAGKQINVCGELSAASAKCVDMVKAIVTGRDEIHGRHPYERGFSFLPIAAHLFSANILPEVNDPSGAFYDRFMILRVENRFRDTAQDNRNLAQDIIRAELGAIAWKAMEAALVAIRQNAITTPPSSIAAIEEWQISSDSVRAWFAEQCELDANFSRRGQAGSVVYGRYKGWAKINRSREIPNNQFAARLKAMRVPHKKLKSGNVWGLVFTT